MSSFEIEIEGGPSFTLDVTSIGPQGDPGVVSVEYPLVLNDPNNTISIAPGYYALQSSLSNYLTTADAASIYATLISPTLSGTPQAPTAAQGTANTQIATTGFVDSWFAPKASPTFSGVVTVPTPTQGDNSQKAASTAFVGSALSAGLAPYLTTASAAATYYPLTNPSGFITSAALSGYATEAWVGLQDYATNTALTNGLAGKANTVHTHDAAAIVSGTIDLARIPIIPSQIQVVSTQNSIATLTPSEQAQITGAGVLVTTTDGNRWVYSGNGSKTDEANYVKVADITPDWTEISNKPAFGTAALANTGDFYPYASNPTGYLVSSDLTPYALISSLGSAAYESTSYWIRSPLVAATDGQIPIWDAATGRSVWSDNNARTLYATVRNNSGVLMPKGSIVYISGGIGANATVTLALADSDPNSARTFGILAQDLADNENGNCIVAGYLSGVNTGAYVEGTQLYLSPTTPGAWTSTKPSAPNHLVYVGKVIRQSATVGAIEVGIQNGYELDELHDVAVSGEAAGDVIYRNAGNTLWVNGSLSAAGILSTSAAASTYLTQANASTTYAALAGTNGFTGANTFTISTGTAVPLTIQNNGTGNSFVVNDQASDTTPFVINASGQVGIQTTTLSTNALTVSGTTALSGNTAVTGTLSATTTITAGTGFTLTNGAANFNVTSGSSVPLTVTNQGTGNSFVVNDQASDTSPFVIDAAGNVGIQKTTASYALDVNGTVNATTYRFSDATTQTTAGISAATAASTYYPLNSNPSGYLTSASLSGYATQSWVTSQGYAVSDQALLTTSGVNFVSVGSNSYLAKTNDPNINSAWTYDYGLLFNDYSGTGWGLCAKYSKDEAVIQGASDSAILNTTSLQFVDVAGGTSATYGVTGITFPDGTIQTTAPTGGGITPPTNYLAPWIVAWDTTNLDWRSNEHKDWVVLLDPSNGHYIDVKGNANNTARLFVSLDGGLTGAKYTTAGVVLPNTTSMLVGSFDTMAGGYGGISLNCAVGYELNWQAGRLSSSYNNGSVFVPIVLDSGLQLNDLNSGIQFADGSFQQTAAFGGIPSPTDTTKKWVATWNETDWMSTETTQGGILYDDGSTHKALFDGSLTYGQPSIRVSNTYGVNWTALTGHGIDFKDGTSQLTAFKTDWTASYQFLDVAAGTQGGPFTYVYGVGIQFPDGSLQSTAASGGVNPFDQSLNKADHVEFYNNGTGRVKLGGDFDGQTVVGVYDQFTSGQQARLRPQGLRFDVTSGNGTYYASDGITFPDGSTQTTAYTGGGGGNPFNQDLNTFDHVDFNSVTTTDTLNGALFAGYAAINPATTTQGSPYRSEQIAEGFSVKDYFGTLLTRLQRHQLDFFDANGASVSAIGNFGVRFPDGSVQMTAAASGGLPPPPDQTKNWLAVWHTNDFWSDTQQVQAGRLYEHVSDVAEFGKGSVLGASRSGVRVSNTNGATWTTLSGHGIEFPDGTLQTTAYTGGGGVATSVYGTVGTNEIVFTAASNGAGGVPYLSLSDYANQQIVSLDYGTGLAFGDYLLGTGLSAKYAKDGITFPDGSFQSTAGGGGGFTPPTPTSSDNDVLVYDQSSSSWKNSSDVNHVALITAQSGGGAGNQVVASGWNSTTGLPSVKVVDSSGNSTYYQSTGIKFADGTEQTTAYAGGGGLPTPTDTSKTWVLAWHTGDFSWRPSEQNQRATFYSDANDIAEAFAFPVTGQKGIRVTSNGGSSWTTLYGHGIEFADGSVQMTAAGAGGLPIPADTTKPWVFAWDSANAQWIPSLNLHYVDFQDDGTYRTVVGNAPSAGLLGFNGFKVTGNGGYDAYGLTTHGIEFIHQSGSQQQRQEYAVTTPLNTNKRWVVAWHTGDFAFKPTDNPYNTYTLTDDGTGTHGIDFTGTSMKFKSGGPYLQVDSGGITFADGSFQSTAASGGGSSPVDLLGTATTYAAGLSDRTFVVDAGVTVDLSMTYTNPAGYEITVINQDATGTASVFDGYSGFYNSAGSMLATVTVQPRRTVKFIRSLDGYWYQI